MSMSRNCGAKSVRGDHSKDRVAAELRQCGVWRRACRSDCSSGYPQGVAVARGSREMMNRPAGSDLRSEASLEIRDRHRPRRNRSHLSPAGGFGASKSCRGQLSLILRGLAPCFARSTHSRGSPARGSRFNCSRFCFLDLVNCDSPSGQSSTSSEELDYPSISHEDAASSPNAAASPSW